MKFSLLCIVVAFVLVLTGCSQTVVKYQCTDGSFVDSIDACPEVKCLTNCPELNCSDCPIQTETVIETDCSTCPVKTETKTEKIYVCPDLTEVKDKDDCIDADSEGWYEVKTFSGAGQKQTEPFQINSDYWRYSISCTNDPDRNSIQEALYHLDIFKISDDEPELIAGLNYQKCSYNNSPNYIYQGEGQYYFDMKAYYLESWSIKVEAKK